MLLTANRESLLSRREEVHFTLTGISKRPLDAIFTRYARGLKEKKKTKQFADLTKSLDVKTQCSQGRNNALCTDNWFSAAWFQRCSCPYFGQIST